MSHAVNVLCRPAVAAGFALAGLTPVEAPGASDAEARLGRLLADPDSGVILAQQRVYDELPPEVTRRMGRRALPMIVPFPDPAWESGRESAEAYIIELLRQVVGYRVRLR